MRLHAKYLCEIAEIQAALILAADDGDEDDEEDEDEEHDEEEEEEENDLDKSYTLFGADQGCAGFTGCPIAFTGRRHGHVYP